MTNIWMQTSKLNNTLNSSGNNFFVLGCAGGAKNATENQVQTTWEDAGTFSNMRINISASGNSITHVFRVGAVNGNETITANSVTGEFTDSTHTDVVAAGNQINYNVSTSTIPPSIETLGIQFAPTTTTNTINKLSCNGSLVDTSLNTTYYNPLVGDLSLNTTEANAQFKNKLSATLQNLYAFISANTASIATIKSHIAAATAGNLVISISSGTTGAMEDTTHTDVITSGTLINSAFQSTVTTTLTCTNISFDLLTTDNTTHYLFGNASGSAVTVNTTTFLAFAGSPSSNATESITRIKPALAFTWSNLEGFVNANANTGTSTVTSRIDSAAANQTISWGSGVTGYQEDTTHTDTVTATNEVGLRLVVGATGASITIGNIGSMATYPSLPNTLSETVTETDSETAISTGLVTLSETITETDSSIPVATASITLSETALATDSYTAVEPYSNTLTETITESDSIIISAKDSATDTESNTASDANAGVATGLTNLNETGAASDTHQGIASALLTLSENNTLTDVYASTQTQPGQNTVTELVTESDSNTVFATDVTSLTENIAANDNYDCQQNSINVVTAPAQTGPSDGNEDNRRKHLDWLKKQKKRRDEIILEKNKNRYAQPVIGVIKPTILPEVTVAEKPIDYEKTAKELVIREILPLLAHEDNKSLQRFNYDELLSMLEDARNEDDEEMLLLLM